MRRQVGRVIGRGISPVVEGLDIDAIVHQIDLQDLLDQVDLDHVLSRVDLNEILDKVDLNRQLERVDMNRLLANVDVNALIERSDLEKIIARSSSSFFTRFLHLVRTRLAMADQWVQRIGRCACCSKDPWLPPRPGMPKRDHTQPTHPNEFGWAIQFRCSGLFTRAIAWITDKLLVAISFSFITWIFETLAERFVPNYESTTSPAWYGVALLIYGLCYTSLWIGCTGRTIGLSILGLLVVNRDGRRVAPCQAILRSFVSDGAVYTGEIGVFFTLYVSLCSGAVSRSTFSLGF
jgi:uncharacterized RDD family membrane protein YckC